MNTHLAPTYQCLLNEHVVLWHQHSNNYSVVTSTYVELLSRYLIAQNSEDFADSLKTDFGFDGFTASKLEVDITRQLETANVLEDSSSVAAANYSPASDVITKCYKAFNHSFKISAQTQELFNYIHPALAHLECKASENIQTEFYLSENLDDLHLFLNTHHYGSFPKKDYHLLQGRFVMLLLGAIHHRDDANWMASFHASTIAKNGKAVMLAGASGKGKSTLTALLTFNGFEFVADDVTGMLYPNQDVYSYPAAISIKAGAFEVLKKTIPEITTLPLAANHPKGSVKFLPVVQQKASHYPCQDIVFVLYSPNPITAALKPISTVTALQTLIPDTWLSPKPEHAKAFLDWLPGLKAYELHYHHNDEAIKVMEALFKN